MQMCELGYGFGHHAPLINSSGIGNYLCGHHALLAHARAYHLFKNEYQSENGLIGISLNSDFNWPKNSDDMVAVERRFQFKVITLQYLPYRIFVISNAFI